MIEKVSEDDRSIYQALLWREPIFHHPERFGRTSEAIEAQMDENFWEVGASGRIYTKSEILFCLLERYADPSFRDIWEIQGFCVACLSPEIYLATYTLIQDQTRITRRSTLWRTRESHDDDILWKAIYHQGTLV